MRGGKRKGAGRKPVQIDHVQLEKLCSLQCTDEELAEYFGVTTRTIENKRKKPEYAEVMRRGRVKGRISVRREQFKLLERGNPSIAIWLGKQYLGQRDVTPIELSGPDGKQLKISLEAIDEILNHES
jgi:hypothetical protein